jgi:hypothetical protein
VDAIATSLDTQQKQYWTVIEQTGQDMLFSSWWLVKDVLVSRELVITGGVSEHLGTFISDLIRFLDLVRGSNG